MNVFKGAAYAASVCALAAVALLVFGQGPDRRTVTAEFSDVRGLVTGAQVRLAGVAVGEVTKLSLGPDGWPRVQMSIDRDVSAARAAVRLASLSGEFNRYVSVVQGPATALIPRSRTTSPVEVDTALSTFDRPTRAALRTVLAGVSQAVDGRALAATLGDSQSTLARITGLAGAIGDDGASLGLALRSAHTIATTLANRTQPLGAALDQSAQLLHTVARQANTLTQGLAALPAGLDAARSTLAQAQALIRPASRLLDAAAPAIAQLPAASNELGDALTAARPTVSRAAQIARLAPRAASALEPLLAEARPLLAVMIPVLGRIGPMLDQLRVRLPDAFSFFANWADFTSNYDANGHAARVGIVLPPAPTNVLSPNSNGPGQLPPPFLRTPGTLEGQPWTDYWKSFVAGGKP
jgi:phospholipid/cholesterol/gamma-HCH transport system substrate-binding protein